MALSIDWSSLVISVPQADLTPVSAGLYELDVDAFRLELKDIEDSEEGMAFPDTHRHNTEVTLSGVTYARIVEIINGYTVTFEDTGTAYTVRCVGANHNLADVKTVNNVSLIVGNSAGLITVSTSGGSGATAAEVWAFPTRGLTNESLLATLTNQSTLLARTLDLWQRLGLDPAHPQTTTETSIVSGGVNQSISESGGTVTVTRNP